MAFATGQPGPALAHRRVQALGQSLDDFQHAGLSRRLHHFGVTGRWFADTDVVGNAALEQVGILEDLADLAGQLLTGHLAHIHAADDHAALGHIEEACDQAHQCGLARAGSAHQCGHTARFDAQADIAQHVGLALGISEADVAQLDGAIERRLGCLWLWQWLDCKNLAHGAQLATGTAQHFAVAGHFQQRVDEAADQQ